MKHHNIIIKKYYKPLTLNMLGSVMNNHETMIRISGFLSKRKES